MILLKKLLLSENTINRVADISRDDIIVGQGGLALLKSKIEEINKKATRWGLDPVKLDILKEEDIKVNLDAGGIDGGGPTQYKKQYTCKIEGKSPQIPGFEFIAKVENTEAGNIINMSPNSSIKELPAEYRDADSKCDVCKSKRERLNTFIIRDETKNELLTVGSTCLKRFLPIDSVSQLINYAEMLESLRSLTQEELDDKDREYIGGSNTGRHHYDVEELIYYLSLSYLVNGKIYISKKKSEELSAEDKFVNSTAGLATNIMFYGPGRDEKPDYMDRADGLKDEAREFSKKVVEYMKGHDFKADAVAKPEMANYFNNLEVLKNSKTANIKYMGYLGGLLASYLINQNMIQKKKEDSERKPSEFVGQIGTKISVESTLKTMRGYDGQYGYITIYGFQDSNGNDLVWFSSNDLGIVENEKYKITATVKDHKTSDPKYGSKKQTIITRAKLQNSAGEKLNESGLMLAELAESTDMKLIKFPNVLSVPK